MRRAIGTLACVLGILGVTAEEPGPFRAERFREHAAFLASDELEGRGLGTPGGARAADFVADRFESVGLRALGDGETFFQAFRVRGEIQARNVLAVFPGTGELATECLIVAAHYDHLPRLE